MRVETFTYHDKNGWSLSQLPALDSPRTLVMVFGGSSYLEKDIPFLELSTMYPQANIVGCSTAGEIHGVTINDESLSVAVVQFDETQVVTGFAPVRNTRDSYAAGESLAQNLAGPNLRAVMVLSDGSVVNGSELVRGINSVLPADVAVTGGLAGDGTRFQQTWVLKNGQPQSGFVSAIGFYGNTLNFGHGSKGGWDIFGPERTVTRSEANRLYELDGKPALALYKEYLGERAQGLPATALYFPLALRTNTTDEKRIVRTILAVDEVTQSMTFAGDIPSGSLVQLMRANFDRLIDGASDAALMTMRDRTYTGDTLSIAISCVGRRIILGERAEEELEATLDALPNTVKQVGFYSYGEISPYTNGHCDLHNQTMTLTTISEG